MSASAYEKTMRQIENPKVSEARIFAAVTKGLELYKDEGNRSQNLKEYLVKNQKLWNMLRHNVSSTENLLPTELRGTLVSLAIWMDRHTAAVLKGDGDVADIITVNNSIAAGLNGQAPGV